MSLISRSTGIHNHLAPRKKHLTPHAASNINEDSTNIGSATDTPQRERPFAPLKFESDGAESSSPSAYKSIFHL
jgi:hypothetical protein